VEPGYGVDLFEDDYLLPCLFVCNLVRLFDKLGLVFGHVVLLLLAADLRMDPAMRPRPVSSVAFAYLGNALQLNDLIERGHIYSPSVFRCNIRSTTPIGMCFSILRIRRNI
jgi:hypothetical protein